MFRGFRVVLICAVSVNNMQSIEIKHFKRQVRDKWSWGYAEITTPQNNVNQTQAYPIVDYNQGPNIDVTTPTTANQEEKGPVECRPFYKPPAKPDYSKPGRRISEAKCYEYIWQLNDRLETKRRMIMCSEYFNSLSGGDDVGGAVGGRPTSPGEFPHMGAVGWKAVIGTWVFKCGSTLISEKFVLTAGHCTRASPLDTTIADPVPKMIRLGDNKITDEEPFTPTNRFKDVEILRIIVHPQYKPPKKYYDIALMELQFEVEFSKVVQPACLWNRYATSDLGKQATATGWGVVEAGTLNISPELQAVTFDVLSNDECDLLLKANRNRNWSGMKDNQICAGNLTGGVDSCQGDSGGPLQMKIPLPKNVTDEEGSLHYVIGVISFGVGCGLPNLPGIYTRVSSFVDWIEDNVWKTS